jgi:YHS domain-containing protein/copper chaperone CopZ
MVAPVTLRDPVCGMNLESYDIALSREYGGQTHVFCSPVCRERFDRDPSRYVPEPTRLEHARIGVAGLPCAGDASKLERQLAKIDGIVRVTVNPVAEEAHLMFDPNRLSLAETKAVVAAACAAFQ